MTRYVVAGHLSSLKRLEMLEPPPISGVWIGPVWTSKKNGAIFFPKNGSTRIFEFRYLTRWWPLGEVEPKFDEHIFQTGWFNHQRS